MDILDLEQQILTGQQSQQPAVNPPSGEEVRAGHSQRLPTVGERFGANLAEGWRTSSLAGGAYVAGASLLNKEAGAYERQRKAAYDAMPAYDVGTEYKTVTSYDDAGNEINYTVPVNPKALLHGAAALGGQLVGAGLLTPETYISPPAKLAQWAVQGATRGTRALRSGAVRTGTGATINLATDPAIQGSRLLTGTQEEYDPYITGANVALGGTTALGTKLPRGPAMSGRMADIVEDLQQRGIREGQLPPDIAEQMAKEVAQFTTEFKRPSDLPKYAGSINLDKINTVEDVHRFISEMSAANFDYTQTRRKSVTVDDMMNIAQDEALKLADDTSTTVDTVLKWHPGMLQNAEGTTRLRVLHAHAAEEATKVARSALASNNPADKARALAMMQKYTTIAAAVSGNATELGRGLWAHNIPVSGALKAEVIDQIINKFGGIENADYILKLIATLDNPKQLSKFAILTNKATGWEKFIEYWQASLLTSPDTHAANIIGTSFASLMSVPEEALTAAIGQVRQKFFGAQDAMRVRDAVTRAQGVWGGFFDGIYLAKKAWDLETIEGLVNKTERNIPAIGGQLGRTIRIPLRALLAEDAIFKTMSERMELHMLANHDATRNGLTGEARDNYVKWLIANPRPWMLERMDHAGKYYTFNKELGELGNAIIRAADHAPQLRLIVPFIRTPINLAKYADERFLNLTRRKEMGKQIREEWTQEGDRMIARMALGWMTILTGMMLAESGHMVGTADYEGFQQANIRETGAIDNAIKVGDTYLGVSRLQPVGVLLSIGANISHWKNHVAPDIERRNLRDIESNQLKEFDVAAAYAVEAAKNTILQGSFVTQLNNVFAAIEDPERSGERLLTTMAGSLVPTIVARAAQVLDPVVRDPQTVGEAISARVPGASQTVEPKLEKFGTEVPREGGVGQFFSPMRISSSRSTPIRNELARLRMEVKPPSRKWGNIELTGKMYTSYSQMFGQFAEETLNEIVAGPAYQQIIKETGGDEQARKIITKIIDKSRKQAQARMQELYPELATVKPEEKVRKLEQLKPREQYEFLE